MRKKNPRVQPSEKKQKKPRTENLALNSSRCRRAASRLSSERQNDQNSVVNAQFIHAARVRRRHRAARVSRGAGGGALIGRARLIDWPEGGESPHSLAGHHNALTLSTHTLTYLPSSPILSYSYPVLISITGNLNCRWPFPNHSPFRIIADSLQ